MLSPLWLTLLLRALPSAIAVPAVSTHSESPPDAYITAIITSIPVHANLPDGECYDIRYCRTLEGLVLSCLVTILACVWFAVHRNIPAPRVHRPRHGNVFVRTGLFVWYKILDQRQAVIVFVVTLLVPEWVLAWALRQWIVAHKLTGRLEDARAEANEKRKELLSKGMETEKEVGEPSVHAAIDELPAEPSGISVKPEHALLAYPESKLLNRVASRRCKKRCEDCDVHKSEYDQVAMAKRVGKANEGQSVQNPSIMLLIGIRAQHGGWRTPFSSLWAATIFVARMGQFIPSPPRMPWS